MVLVAPGYLNKDTLPYASDIFYFKKLIYFMPTGFHPREHNSVIFLPLFCSKHSIGLPEVIWKMRDYYFSVEKDAVEAANILKPLRNRNISLVLPSYPREINAIDRERLFLANNRDIYNSLIQMPFDIGLTSRELFSHILFAVNLEKGYDGAIDYLLKNCETSEKFLDLVAAVIVNRIKIFSNWKSVSVTTYDPTWFPLIQQFIPTELTDSGKIESFCFKLFEAILYPIFGRCDNLQRNLQIALIAEGREEQIDALKEQCRFIASEVILLATNDTSLKQERLNKLITELITNPLTELTEKPKKEVRQILVDFLTDSTVLTGILTACFQSFDFHTLGISLLASGCVAIARYLRRQNMKTRLLPSKFLLEGIDEMKTNHEKVIKELAAISYNQLTDFSL